MGVIVSWQIRFIVFDLIHVNYVKYISISCVHCFVAINFS